MYALVTMSFFIALVRWTIRSERQCSCGGVLGRDYAMIHGVTSCYPAAEALGLRA